MPRRHTILVVDDEADVVKSLRDLLRFEYKVLGTTHPTEAMQILDQEPVDVVMSDQRMPEMSGVELLNRIREQHPTIMRLLFTGYADIRAVIEAINKGHIYRYITKPWDADELQATLREACDRHDLLEERKQLIEELRQKNEELERANKEMLQASKLKDAFIEVASHELRTPLTILMGLTDLAIRVPNTPPPLPDVLNRISQAGRRLHYLVDQLVKMLSAGLYARPLDLRETDIIPLIKQAADDVRPFIDLRHQTLNLRLPANPCPVRLDGFKIRDSVNHVLLNAIKFTPDQGNISLTTHCAAGGVEIQITDDGVGLDAATLQRVSEPFFTGDDVSQHSSGQFEFGRKGLGLGLSVARRFIEMHGGRMTFASQIGKGTTVTIWLPAQI